MLRHGSIVSETMLRESAALRGRGGVKLMSGGHLRSALLDMLCLALLVRAGVGCGRRALGHAFRKHQTLPELVLNNWFAAFTPNLQKGCKEWSVSLRHHRFELEEAAHG